MQTSSTINLNYTINSGQVFLWDKIGDMWAGINGDDLLVIKDPFQIISSQKKASHFFRLDDNITKTLSAISKDSLVGKAVRQFPGLRLLRQDPFQCYISFICSSNSSIRNIRNMLTRLCVKFGNKIEFENHEFFTFPSAEKLANVTTKDLLSCGLGFRAKYVRDAVKAVNSGRIEFESIRKTDYKTSLETLKTVKGIGNKIADCILLFSLDKLESFPIDRWTNRILQKYYPKIFDSAGGKSLTEKKYAILHEKIVDHFGPYAGYSQQFLFKLERDLNKKNWL
ncbi:MAG: DNA repair protein [Thaumarchaeota archaeon]|nr:DNA repair protein [Nitrososphaerota archaeon]